MRILLCLLALTHLLGGCDAPQARQETVDTAGVSLPMDVLVVGARHKVRTVVDGDTITLATGKDVRMVGTQAPKLPLGRPNFEAWPLGDAAKDYLATLVDGQGVTLYFGGLEEDRHGRWLAHLVRDDGLWLQGAMLEAGFARVYTFPDNRSAVNALLAAEAVARRENKGIWRHPYYAIRTPKEMEADPDAFVDSFQIVRGRVDGTGDAGGRLFINFGGDWSTDFTAVAARGARRKFADAPQFDRDRLEGSLVEIRGWVEARQGPSIELTHPEQLVYVED
ncbi:MAG: thermonuclease family protein [Pseudomonadota bacterium]